jgi:replicative DNA helicase
MKASALPVPPKHDPDSIVLPQNIEAERATLGAALVNTMAADYLTDHLTAQDFFRRAHQTIFLAIRELRTRGTEIDFVTLKAELTRTKQLTACGGPAYLSALTDGMPASTHVDHYAALLRDLHAKRALIQYANLTLDHVVSGEHGAQTLIADADRRLIDLHAGHLEGRLRPLQETTGDLMADLEWRVAHRGELTGIDTGYASINELTYGWQPGDMNIIAARPSIGKTTFVMNTAVAAARTADKEGRPRRVAIFSLEMRRKQLEYRLLSSLSGVPLQRVLAGSVMGPDYPKISQAVSLMGTLGIDIDDRSGQSVWEIRSACRRLRAEKGLDLVVIDYVQLMPGTLERRGANRNEEVTDISRRLKALADECSVPILVLSQLSRANIRFGRDPLPKISDLRESGALEQDADLVCLLHRKNHREGGVTNFVIAKQRNGPTGSVNLTLDRDTVTFLDGGEEPPPPPPKEKKPAKRSRADEA